VLDIGVEIGVIEKSGSWYAFNGERIGQGRNNVKTYFNDNPDIYQTVVSRVRESLGLPQSKETKTETPA